MSAGLIEERVDMPFIFFSNRLGCVGSVIVSIVLTLVLLVMLRSCASSY